MHGQNHIKFTVTYIIFLYFVCVCIFFLVRHVQHTDNVRMQLNIAALLLFCCVFIYVSVLREVWGILRFVTFVKYQWLFGHCYLNFHGPLNTKMTCNSFVLTDKLILFLTLAFRSLNVNCYSNFIRRHVVDTNMLSARQIFQSLLCLLMRSV